MDVYLKEMKKHYINQVKWHAAAILGSVDFLGNPLGFANDLSEGVSGLIFEGSVKSLVKNVTHGISNSTAKLGMHPLFEVHSGNRLVQRRFTRHRFDIKQYSHR